MSQPGNEKTMRTITLEEHFVTPAFMEGPGRGLGERPSSPRPYSDGTNYSPPCRSTVGPRRP